MSYGVPLVPTSVCTAPKWCASDSMVSFKIPVRVCAGKPFIGIKMSFVSISTDALRRRLPYCSFVHTYYPQ